MVYVLLLIFADQLSKYLVRHYRGFYICNLDAAFGIHLPQFIFWIFWIAIIVFVSGLYLKNKSNAGYIFILSGALSNFIDRIYFGCIIDFIDLKFWPVFNLADIFITVGVIMLILKIKK